MDYKGEIVIPNTIRVNMVYNTLSANTKAYSITYLDKLAWLDNNPGHGF
jgi:hypothetical protein